jgi:hypothetical protein
MAAPAGTTKTQGEPERTTTPPKARAEEAEEQEAEEQRGSVEAAEPGADASLRGERPPDRQPS